VIKGKVVETAREGCVRQGEEGEARLRKAVSGHVRHGLGSTRMR
jgi:hypothetical protein